MRHVNNKHTEVADKVSLYTSIILDNNLATYLLKITNALFIHKAICTQKYLHGILHSVR